MMKVCRHHFGGVWLALSVLAAGAAWGDANEPADLGPGDPAVTLAPRIDSFEQWLRQTGEQAPDFSKFKPVAGLPPLLRLEDGRAVRTPEEWTARRAELRALLEQWIYGHAPQVAAPRFQAEALGQTPGDGAIDREVRLTYDSPQKVSFVIRVMVPPGPGPFPVFMTQWNHREWAAMAVARGYLACLYPGSDDNDAAPLFAAAYPQADWRLLRQRAWLCSRVLDYLVTLPEADKAHVALTGHSRNGKQSLVAAAFDERISAVVSSSAGSGGSVPWRFSSDVYFNESVEVMSRHTPARTWFTPRIRFFVGREQLLPIDNHALLGLIAPRPCLISDALYDGCGSILGGEQEYLAGREVYRFLGHPEALRILYRQSNHETLAKDIENYFDWYDVAFGRMKRDFPEQLYQTFDWGAWRERQDAGRLKIAKDAGVRERILWGLGEAPATVLSPGSDYGGLKAHTQGMVGREMTPVKGASIIRKSFSFGEYVAGDLYYPAKASEPLPVVVWLSPLCTCYGYNAQLNAGGQFYQFMARQGYLVVTFDQIGTGVRQMEKTAFYSRYPQWSLLGKMVHDARAALDCVLAGAPAPGGKGLKHPWFDIPAIDPKRVTVVGYGMGALAGIYAAALDPRITAVASFCGFTPLRSDTAAQSTGGLRRLWELYALQPRLGLYEGREAELPYDYDDLLRLVAPRPCLVYAPLYDREADAAAVKRCVESAQGAWRESGRAEGLTLLQPPDFSRFQTPQFMALLEWLGRK